MNSNFELETWRLSWAAPDQQARIAAFDLRREGRRQEWRLRARHILELGFAGTLIAFAGFFLYRNFSAEILVWAVVVWTTTLAATGFSLWNWRVLWEATGQSTAEYVAAYRSRCIAGLRAVRFGFALLAIQLSITAPWLTWDFFHHEIPGLRYGLGMGFLALVTTGLVGMLIHQRRGALVELDRLEEFQRSLSED